MAASPSSHPPVTLVDPHQKRSTALDADLASPNTKEEARGSGGRLQEGVTSEILRQLVTSGVAVTVATAITHPIDVVKVRQQLETMGQRASSTNMAKVAARLVREEGGAAALYRGVGPALVRSACYGGLRLGLYDPLKRALRPGAARYSLLEKLTAAALSGSIATALTSPLELAKVRLQSRANSQQQHSQQQQQRRPRASALGELRQVLKTEGVVAMWRGVGPSMARASGLTAAQLATYDESKQALKERLGLADGLTLHLSASMAAGLVGTAVTSPFDVVKTRLMAQRRQVSPAAASSPRAGERRAAATEYRGSFHCALSILRREGLAGLYKGWSANYVRLGPQTAITFVVYERMRQVMGLSTL